MLGPENNGHFPQLLSYCMLTANEVVLIASAVVPGAVNAEAIAIHADHVEIVKFASSEDTGYEKISGYLQLMIRESSNATKTRWEEQDRIEKGVS